MSKANARRFTIANSGSVNARDSVSLSPGFEPLKKSSSSFAVTLGVAARTALWQGTGNDGV